MIRTAGRQIARVCCRSLVLLLVAGVAMNAQSSPSSASLERLETLGKLWAAVKYFHPRLGYDLALNWDQALLDAVPELVADADEGRYRATVERMLDRLEDSATRVVSPPTPGKP